LHNIILFLYPQAQPLVFSVNCLFSPLSYSTLWFGPGHLPHVCENF
jgi:hypothetical protein